MEPKPTRDPVRNSCPQHPAHPADPHTLGDRSYRLIEHVCNHPRCNHVTSWRVRSRPELTDPRMPSGGPGPCRISVIIQRAMRVQNRAELRSYAINSAVSSALMLVAVAAAVMLSVGSFLTCLATVLCLTSAGAAVHEFKQLARCSDPHQENLPSQHR